MARTRTQLRQLVTRQFETPFVSGTIAASGNTTASFVDTPRLGQFADDQLNGGWVYLSSGSPSFADLRITNNVQSTGAVSYRPTIGAAPDSITYEILPFSATAIHQALDETLLEMYERELLGREFWLNHYLMGSPIYNSTFDYWPTTTTVDGWTASAGSPAQVIYKSDNVVPGEYAVRLSQTSTFTLDAKYRRFLQDFEGHTPTMYVWIRSDTASADRVQLLADGSVVDSTPYHSGNSTWELLNVSLAIPAAATEITVRLDHTGAGNGDYGAVWLDGGPRVREYPFPIGLAPDGPTEIRTASVSVDTGNKTAAVRSPLFRPLSTWDFNKYEEGGGTDEVGVLVLTGNIRSHQSKRLWMKADAPLTIPSSDTDNIEVTYSESLMVAKLTAANLAEKDAWNGEQSYKVKVREFAGRLRSEVEAGLGDEPDAQVLPMGW